MLSFISEIQKFATFTLLFKYFTENLIYDVVSFAIDLMAKLFTLGSRRELLNQNEVNLTFIIISGFFLTVKLVLLGIFIKICSLKNSKLQYLFYGINLTKLRLWVYFGHYIIIRIVLAILVVLTEVFDKKWLFIVLLAT